jgi:hypothetical protein
VERGVGVFRDQSTKMPEATPALTELEFRLLGLLVGSRELHCQVGSGIITLRVGQSRFKIELTEVSRLS